MLLAIDTSAGTSVAIVDRDRGVLAEALEEDTRRHAEAIGTLLDRCLADAHVPVSALTGIAVGMGPGPFTGLRVGIAAANAFTFAAGTPILRVVSHDALAFAHYQDGGTGRLLVTTDARRRERYWSAYSGTDEFSIPLRTQGPGFDRPEKLPSTVTDYESYNRVDASWVSAAAVGLLAARLRERGGEFAGPEPLYLRSPDVTVPAAPKRVTG